MSKRSTKIMPDGTTLVLSSKSESAVREEVARLRKFADQVEQLQISYFQVFYTLESQPHSVTGGFALDDLKWEKCTHEEVEKRHMVTGKTIQTFEAPDSDEEFSFIGSAPRARPPISWDKWDDVFICKCCGRYELIAPGMTAGMAQHVLRGGALVPTFQLAPAMQGEKR